MPSKSAQGLNEKGMSKPRAVRIANSPDASKHVGQKSGSGSSPKQGGTTAQKREAAARAGGPQPVNGRHTRPGSPLVAMLLPSRAAFVSCLQTTRASLENGVGEPRLGRNESREFRVDSLRVHGVYCVEYTRDQ
jgi:hypothetical protein